MKFSRNGQIIPAGVSFGIHENGVVHFPIVPEGEPGVNYPSDWLRANREEREALGFVEIVEPVEPFNERYYFSAVQPRPLSDVLVVRRNEVRELRERKRDLGSLWGQQPIWTDRESCADYTSLVVAVQAGLREDGSLFRFPDGVKPLANADVIGMAAAAFGYIQSLYSRQAELDALLTAAETVDAMIAVDITTGW